MVLVLFKIALFILFYALWEFFLSKPRVDDFAKGLKAAESDDFETAYHQWRPLAEGGNSDAQYNLGWMYYYGEGVTRNLKTARKWLNRAMKQGDPRPYWLLGKVYSELGTMYQEGNGVSQNSKKANKYFLLSAEYGEVGAEYHRTLQQYYHIVQNEVGESGVSGKMVTSWEEKAARGDKDSLFNLGVFYEEVVKGKILAHTSYQLAAEFGDQKASRKMKSMERGMTTPELLKAEDLTKQFLKQSYKEG